LVTVTSLIDVLPDGTNGTVQECTALTGGDGNRTGSMGGYIVTSGSTYTLSFYVKNINCSGFSGNVYDTTVPGVIANIVYPTISVGLWTRVSVTFTVPSPVGNHSIGPQFYRDGGYGTFRVCWFQLEQLSFASPYINGTRGTSNNLIDLTNNNTITSTSLTYYSNNTFSFNGTSDLLSTTTLPYQFLTSGFTVSTAFRYTQTTTNDNLISWGNSAFNSGALSYSWEIRIRGAGAVEFAPGVYTSGTGPARMSYTPSSALNGRDVILDVVYTANGVSYIYENGTKVATYDYTGVGTYANTQSLRVGRGTDSNFPGKIYSTKIYNKALSATEVQQNFNAIRGRFNL
jgi:hypothetical protein